MLRVEEGKYQELIDADVGEDVVLHDGNIRRRAGRSRRLQHEHNPYAHIRQPQYVHSTVHS